MAPERILILGGSPNQVYELIQNIPDSYSIKLQQIEQYLNEINKSSKPSLIIVIPGASHKNALELLDLIRAIQDNLPVLFLAANPDNTEIIEAFRRGATDYFVLPLQPEDLCMTIDKHIRKQRQGKQLLKNWIKIFRRPFLQVKSKPGRKLVLPNPLEGYSFAKHNPPESNHDVEVQLLGELKVRIKHKLLPNLPGEKANALLAYFLLNHKIPVHRDLLLDKFWGYTSTSAARNSLNVAMHNIRRHIQEHCGDIDLLQYKDGRYAVNVDLDVGTDVDHFLANWQTGRNLEAQQGLDAAFYSYEKATEYYRGNFLVNIRNEDWCEVERTNLKEKYLLVLDRLSAYFFQKGDFKKAASVFHKMLENDNCMEAIHRKLIFCYYQLGQRDKAIKQFHKCANALKKGLDIQPSQLSRELYQLVKAEKSIPTFLF